MGTLRGPFKNVFDYIILICPTYDRNKTYHGFAKNDKNFLVLMPDASNQAEIEELLHLSVVLFSGTNTLIILHLDDCAVSKDLKNRSNKFIELAFSGRHKGLSVWVLTQQLTSIAKPFRDNVGCVVGFHNPSQMGTKTLFEDFGGDLDIHTSIHHFSGAPRGAFQQPVYNKCKVRWLRVLARPLQAVHKVFFV